MLKLCQKWTLKPRIMCEMYTITASSPNRHIAMTSPIHKGGYQPSSICFVFECLNEFEMLKWRHKWIDYPQIRYTKRVTIVSRTNSYFALARSILQDDARRPFWIWAPHGVCPHFHNRHPSYFLFKLHR